MTSDIARKATAIGSQSSLWIAVGVAVAEKQPRDPAVPMVVLYLVGQRFFIRGLTAGGVKG